MKPQAKRTWAGLLAAAVAGMAATTPARAEIETIVEPGSKFLPAFSAPKLPLIPGWETDVKASVASQTRLLFPQGGSREKPGALIAARAIPKTATQGLLSLADLIDNQHIDARAKDPGLEITEIPMVTDKAGRRIRVFAERGSTRISFRVVGYGEEKDALGAAYWTIFAVNTDSQDAMAQAVGPFQDMLRNYR